MMGVGNNGIDYLGHTVVLWCFLRFGQEKSLSGSFISSKAGSSFPYSAGDTIDEDSSEEAGDHHQASKDGQKPILDHL